MKKVLLSIAVTVLLLLIAAGSFVLGARSQRKQLAAGLDAVQAMLWFNHLLTFRKLEADLSKGCSAVALERTRMSIDQEMDLLSDFHKEHPNSWANKYISDRDPTLLAQLETFKRRYGESWKEPECTK